MANKGKWVCNQCGKVICQAGKPGGNGLAREHRKVCKGPNGQLVTFSMIPPEKKH